MDSHERQALDRYITGNYGEDQFKASCFACGRRCGEEYEADTRDDQIVFVGSECYKRIASAGEEGYQPPLGGPRLWLVKDEDPQRYSDFEDRPDMTRLSSPRDQER